MRSERREARREEEKRQKAAKRKNGGYRVLAVIYVIALVAFLFAIVHLNVIPNKYLYILIGVLVVITLFIVPVMYSRYGIRRRKMVASIFAVVLIAGFGLGAYYLSATDDFLGDISIIHHGEERHEITVDYYVLVRSDAGYTDVAQLAGKGVGTYINGRTDESGQQVEAYDENYTQAKDMLSRDVPVEYRYVSDLQTLLDGLFAGGLNVTDEATGLAEFQPYDAVFLSKSRYDILLDSVPDLQERTEILKKVTLTVSQKNTVKAVNVTREPFNVYISGLDIQGSIANQSRSDVNMIVTVNPKSHEVLITSIPRDYYVYLPDKQASDKLTHTGIYGIEETIAAVEQMMGININYYVKVNYSTVINLVDAMGGIEIDSPYAFTTHKMQDLSGISFAQGYNALDGRMALAYCRERASWSDGDMRRNENQQIILEAIIKKATGSTAILTSYTDILNAVRDNLETNFSEKEMKSLVKMQLDDMPDWDIQKTALKGRPDAKLCYALGAVASVVDQDHEQIAMTTDMITRVMNDE